MRAKLRCQRWRPVSISRIPQPPHKRPTRAQSAAERPICPRSSTALSDADRRDRPGSAANPFALSCSASSAWKSMREVSRSRSRPWQSRSGATPWPGGSPTMAPCCCRPIARSPALSMRAAPSPRRPTGWLTTTTWSNGRSAKSVPRCRPATIGNYRSSPMDRSRDILACSASPGPSSPTPTAASIRICCAVSCPPTRTCSR